MPSTFFGYEVAKSGLFTNQVALNVTAHNLMNADTKGYTRQIVNQQQILPYSALSISPLIQRGTVGAGVSAVNIYQARDLFLDNAIRSQSSKQSAYVVKADTLSYIESLFDETSDGSITNAYQDLFAAFQNLSAGQGSASLASRENVKQAALALCYSLNSKYNQLVDMQKSINAQLDNGISDINSIAQGISELNGQIYRYELCGQNANDLRDRRALLLDQLAEYTDYSLKYDSKGKATITIGGEKLVDGTTDLVNKIYTDTDGSMKWSMANGDGTYTDTSNTVAFADGYIKAYMDVRDGTGGTYGISTVIGKINDFTAALVETINGIHREGYGLPPDSTNGIDFFDASGVTAGTIRLSDEILEDISYIAAASKQVIYNLPVETDTETNEGQNLNLLNIISAMNDKLSGVFGGTEMSFEEYLRKMVVELGGQAKFATQAAENEEILLQNYLNQRASISGVSMDEEVSNLMKYQRSYEAAARLMTIMDEAVDTLLKMGIVGR